MSSPTTVARCAPVVGEGDELAVELFDMAIEVVAGGIGSATNMVDVELVVIGGGMAEKLGQDLADRIGHEARQWILYPRPKLKFVVAAFFRTSGQYQFGLACASLAPLIRSVRASPSSPVETEAVRSTR